MARHLVAGLQRRTRHTMNSKTVSASNLAPLRPKVSVSSYPVLATALPTSSGLVVRFCCCDAGGHSGSASRRVIITMAAILALPDTDTTEIRLHMTVTPGPWCEWGRRMLRWAEAQPHAAMQ